MSNVLLDYITSHENWETELQSAPYNLFVRTSDDFPNLRLFTYNQIKSDMTNPVVKVSRGIIVDIVTLEVVCYPFDKFFNYNDPRTDTIDWSTARIQEKVDGSIMKLYWYAGEWQIATNGTINAMNTDLPTPAPGGVTTFGQLFKVAFGDMDARTSELNKAYTYIFELVSPYNRVVVPHTEPKLYHLGTRVNVTGEELDVSIGFDKPKQYAFQTFDEMVAAAEALPFDEEGYVVVDAQWHRAKVKSLAYLQVHHLADNGNVSKDRILNLVRTGEDEEFLQYYPEYTEIFDEVRVQWNDHLAMVEQIKKRARMLKEQSADRKAYAMAVQQLPKATHGYFFALLDGRLDRVEELLDKLTVDKLFEVGMEL
jgi:T4 RnlA family RNA ligase